MTKKEAFAKAVEAVAELAATARRRAASRGENGRYQSTTRPEKIVPGAS